MLHEKTTFPLTELSPFARQFFHEDMLLFDIETTGLSAAYCTVYCIGCGYVRGDEGVVELFFAHNLSEESEILTAFLHRLTEFSSIVTFNGSTFDLPFLEKRMHLTECSPFAKKVSVDLYREAQKLKRLLDLPALRQKNIEEFLGIHRQDLYNGGQLIDLYRLYAFEQSAQLLTVLLLHNREDVRGMFDLPDILAYRQLVDGDFQITDVSYRPLTNDSPGKTKKIGELLLVLSPYAPLPRRIHRIEQLYALLPGKKKNQKADIGKEKMKNTNDAAVRAMEPDDALTSFLIGEDKVLLTLPVFHGTLKHFFADYKNYYYLPAEDCAIHKSVGAYVEAAHRQKATRQTCYTKKECAFILLPVDSKDNYLRREYDEKMTYVPWPTDDAGIRRIVIDYFKSLIK